jgi:hypothetical protein
VLKVDLLKYKIHRRCGISECLHKKGEYRLADCGLNMEWYPIGDLHIMAFKEHPYSYVFRVLVTTDFEKVIQEQAKEIDDLKKVIHTLTSHKKDINKD